MESEHVWQLVTNPAWRPLTESDTPGYIFLGACATLLIGLTIWTYIGSSASSSRRIGILIALRLAALLLAIITALRPAASITEIPKLPSTLIVVVDSSESMTVKDEANYTRWEVVQKVIGQCEPLFNQLRDDQQVTIYQYHFAKDFEPDRDKYSNDLKAEGKRTDFGTMLSKIYDRHQGEKLLRGLVIVSDGADNGTTKSALREAARFRGVACPIYCFAVGSTTSQPQEKDISFASISPDPSPAAIKSDIKVKAKLNAQGFEGTKVRVQLTVDDKKEVQEFTLTKSTDNEIEFTTKAPEKPGEAKISLELIDPPSNQVTTLNDKIETYLTITKEGVRVLVFAKNSYELAFIRKALASDKRFDYVEATLSSLAAGSAEDARRFDIKDQGYDVILIGDVAPEMLTARRPAILQEIRDLVTEKGVGLVMMGGNYTLGGTQGKSEGWTRTPLAQILPVVLPPTPPENIKNHITFEPTELGARHFLLKMDADPVKNAANWKMVNTGALRLQGYSPLGTPKPNAEVLARVNDPLKGDPIMVASEIDKSRVLALGVGDTQLWHQPVPGNIFAARDLHHRFWKQMILWLAHQDEMEGNVYVRPEFRRLVAGGQQTIVMGLRDKRGNDIPEADLKYQIVGPDEQPNKEKAKRAEPNAKGGAKVTIEQSVPAEYRVIVWGEGKDAAGEAISESATARYIIYPDVSDEMLRPAANPNFLLALENAANGTALIDVRRADRLPAFIEDMKSNPIKMNISKAKPYPDWRRDKQSWFLPALLVFFTAILGMEWGLRRMWGMV
jgi:uncharacterized membrane protein